MRPALPKIQFNMQYMHPVRLCTSPGATCYDNAAANCGGNVIPGMSTRDCCLRDGFWVNQTNGECVQCIGKYVVIVINIVLRTELLSSNAYKCSNTGAKFNWDGQ